MEPLQFPTKFRSHSAREWELYAEQLAVAGRPLDFIYFGGGTPSFLSVRQLQGLIARLHAVAPWSTAQEITFECEPGTLTEPKLAAIRELGVTRLSLGIENFDDRILEINGRAHRSAEVFRAYDFARNLEFPQVNIDLIAGMLGETDDNWKACVNRTIELSPDSVTIYQMELPFNTTISGDLMKGTGRFADTVAQWSTKRRWVAEAYEALERAGYTVGSAYTAVKDPTRTKFLYRAACGRALIWWDSASRRSVMSTACMSRIWTRGRPTRKRSAQVGFRSIEHIGQLTRNASSASSCSS